MLIIAENNFRHQWAATHTESFLLTAGAGSAHFIAESLKWLAIPGVFDGSLLAKLHLIALLLVEGAGHHHHVRADIAAVPPALAGVQRLRQDAFAEVQRTGDIARVHAHLEWMSLVHLSKKLRYSRICEVQHIGLQTLSRRFVQQKDHRVDSGWKIVVFQIGGNSP